MDFCVNLTNEVEVFLNIRVKLVEGVQALLVDSL